MREALERLMVHFAGAHREAGDGREVIYTFRDGLLLQGDLNIAGTTLAALSTKQDVGPKHPLIGTQSEREAMRDKLRASAQAFSDEGQPEHAQLLEDARSLLSTKQEGEECGAGAAAFRSGETTPFGFYVASRASLPERPAMWRKLRDEGAPINSTWIDEAGEGETHDLGELWARIHQEIAASEGVILYAKPEDFPLKGALIECGIALGMGKPVAIILDQVKLELRSCRPLGSWCRHPACGFAPSGWEEAVRFIRAFNTLKQEGLVAGAESVRSAVIRASEHPSSPASPTPEERGCDDAEVMRIWRECGLPEYFLGNGGSNHKLVAFAKACALKHPADVAGEDSSLA